MIGSFEDMSNAEAIFLQENMNSIYIIHRLKNGKYHKTVLHQS